MLMDYLQWGLKRHVCDVPQDRIYLEKEHHRWHTTSATCYHIHQRVWCTIITMATNNYTNNNIIRCIKIIIRIIELRCVSSLWGGGFITTLSPLYITKSIASLLRQSSRIHSDIGRILNVRQHQIINGPVVWCGIILDMGMESGTNFILHSTLHSFFRGCYYLLGDLQLG
jgi:hypothetical protein